MFHIKSLIPQFLQKKQIKTQIEAVGVCKLADKILKQAFGLPRRKAGSKDAKAVFFKNSTLQIKCSNSVLANEVQLRKERIKNELNEELGREIVKNILTKIG